MRMISAWEWVGITLITFGMIVFGAGIYYIFNPETRTALAYLNPSLWWGAIMLFAGLLLLLTGRRGNGAKS